VIAFAQAAAGSPVDVTVTPDPANARPGDRITVTISAHQGIGALAGVANALADVMHITHPFPNGQITIASTTTMREE
jgi:hypothetical protein